MKYEWSQDSPTRFLYADPIGMMVAQVEYDDHTGAARWIGYDLTGEFSVKIGAFGDAQEAKVAVERYFQKMKGAA
jgi:hypothetical protein